jgi:hypothetical protein
MRDGDRFPSRGRSRTGGAFPSRSRRGPALPPGCRPEVLEAAMRRHRLLEGPARKSLRSSRPAAVTRRSPARWLTPQQGLISPALYTARATIVPSKLMRVRSKTHVCRAVEYTRYCHRKKLRSRKRPGHADSVSALSFRAAPDQHVAEIPPGRAPRQITGPAPRRHLRQRPRPPLAVRIARRAATGVGKDERASANAPPAEARWTSFVLGTLPSRCARPWQIELDLRRRQYR